MTTAILAYLIYLVIVLIINAAVLYHFIKYSFPGDVTKLIALIYSLVIVFVVSSTFFLIGII